MNNLIKRLQSYDLTSVPYQSYHALMEEAAVALIDLQSLVDASKKTLNNNLHLCDGDNCTLYDLRTAVEKIDPTWRDV